MKTAHILLAYLLLLASAFASCSRSSEAKARLDAAEALIVSRPDSAMAILCGIDTARLVSKADWAHYALLMSMALDKSYVDTTSFAVLQPAIDYYLKKGTPDQKLRTYYYQGRIYQNRHEYDSAMVAFIRGKEYSAQAADTLTAANLLVAQGNLLYDSNIIEDYIELNLLAAKMYREIGRTDYEASSLINALGGNIAIMDEDRADSLVSAIELIVGQDEGLAPAAAPMLLSYIIRFGDREDISDAISGFEPEDLNDDNLIIDFANAYKKLEDGENALRFLEATSPNGKLLVKYASSKPDILDLCGNKSEALVALREATNTIDSINKAIFYNDLLFLQERYAMEKAELVKQRRMDRIVWISISIALAMLVAFSFIYYRYRLNRAKSEKLQLESENMQHRIAELENERETLRQVVDDQSDLAKPVKEAVKVRLKMLNDLLASMIIEKGPKRLCACENWCSKMLSDKEEFVNATRQAFEVTNPGFISYLEQHELTDEEINIACLLAIGLKGMEIGNYLQTKNLYRVSSTIRRKLNLDSHQANLGKIIHDILMDT